MKKYGFAMSILVAGCGAQVTEPVVGRVETSTLKASEIDVCPPSPTTPAPTPTSDCGATIAIPRGEVCIALLGNRVRYIPLDGSPGAEGPTLSFTPYQNNASLGLRGTDLYTCNTTVTRISLFDGNAEMTDVPCDAVTADEKGIWVQSLRDMRVTKYADHEHLVAHDPAAEFVSTYASRIAVSGDELVTSWHSTNDLMVGPAAGPSRTVELADYNGWIMGLARMGDGSFVIGTWFSEGTLRRFDGTGKPLKTIPTSAGGGELLNGIVCGKDLVPSGCKPGARKASVRIAENCGGGGYTSSNYTEPQTTSETEVHVIGVYESETNAVSVHVKKTKKPVTLVLSSYERNEWKITVDPGATLAKVVTQGYERQVVTGVPSGTSVVRAEGGYAYGWEAEHNTGGGNFPQYMSDIRAREGKETSFQGCYSGKSFEVPYQ